MYITVKSVFDVGDTVIWSYQNASQSIIFSRSCAMQM